MAAVCLREIQNGITLKLYSLINDGVGFLRRRHVFSLITGEKKKKKKASPRGLLAACARLRARIFSPPVRLQIITIIIGVLFDLDGNDMRRIVNEACASA